MSILSNVISWLLWPGMSFEGRLPLFIVASVSLLANSFLVTLTGLIFVIFISVTRRGYLNDADVFVRCWMAAASADSAASIY